MAYHESLRGCDRCFRETRHFREDLLPIPRDFRFIALIPVVILVNHRLSLWTCLEHDEADDIAEID